jgi:hypothetical protein
MRWEQVVTHEDAYASLVRSQHRRQAVDRRRRLRLVWRGLTTPLFLLGVLVAGWAVVTFDSPDIQAVRVSVGIGLMVPFLATFDLLGEARR